MGPTLARDPWGLQTMGTIVRDWPWCRSATGGQIALRARPPLTTAKARSPVYFIWVFRL